jgi:hypothetical protein
MPDTLELGEIPEPIDDIPPPLPWERGGMGSENETDQSFEAFEIYRELGLQRSLAKTAAALGKSTPMMERWNRRHNWQNRIRAWDRHSSRIINERVLMGTAAMRERAAAIGLNLQVRASQRLLKMTDAEVDSLSVNELASMIRIGTQVETSARTISAEEIDGALRDSAPVFNIGFVTQRPEGMISVRLPTGECGYIAKEFLGAFQADYPEATVIA